MFNLKVINQALDAHTMRLRGSHQLDGRGKPLFDSKFELQYHSIAQVAQANGALANAYKVVDGSTEKKKVELVRDFTAAEARWIQNERAICASDFYYWATRYGFIIHWDKTRVRFAPNRAQEVMLSLLSELEGMGVALLIQALKARQLGITTITELIILWQTIFHPFTSSLVASSDPTRSSKMAYIMELCFENQPFWLVPNLTGYSKGNFIEFKGISSFISIQHGTQMTGLARGSTPNKFHLSEVAEYDNPEQLIDAALLFAIHDTPEVFGVLESTAMGRHNYWHNKWLTNIKDWPTRRSRMCPMFLPWYIGRDIYPTETWLHAHPVPIDWEPEELTHAHAVRATEYVQSGRNELVTRQLGSGWSMPREQMWYWEVERAAFKQSNRLNDFYAELCADDKEAFQSANSSIFDTELITAFQEHCKMPKAVYGLLAPKSEFPARFQPNERDIDPRFPPIDIVAEWSPTQPKHEYRLVPLLYRGQYGQFDPDNKIQIWEYPEAGEYYGIGTDAGLGRDKDSLVLSGIRKGSLQRNDAQVFEYACNSISAMEAWPLNLALGTLYSVFTGGKIRQCKQVIECQANGEIIQHELHKRGWTHFHRWMRFDKKSISEEMATRIGWYTVAWSRNMMLDMLLDALNNGWLDINSGWFVDEMSELEYDFEKRKLAAAAGMHDDRIMALGIVLFSMHYADTRGKDGWSGRELRQGLAPVRWPTYNGGDQASDKMERMGALHPGNSQKYQVISPASYHDPLAELMRDAGASLVDFTTEWE